MNIWVMCDNYHSFECVSKSTVYYYNYLKIKLLRPTLYPQWIHGITYWCTRTSLWIVVSNDRRPLAVCGQHVENFPDRALKVEGRAFWKIFTQIRKTVTRPHNKNINITACTRKKVQRSILGRWYYARSTCEFFNIIL